MSVRQNVWPGRAAAPRPAAAERRSVRESGSCMHPEHRCRPPGGVVSARADEPARSSVTIAVDRHQRLRCFKLRSEEHTSELQSLMRLSYAVFCLKKKRNDKHKKTSERRKH